MTTTPNPVCPMLAVAVEIAAAKWVVASYTGGACKVRRKSLQQEAVVARFEALLSELVEARKRWGLDASARLLVAYEAGQEGFWLVRALRARGVAAEVIDPVSLQVDRRSRRAKTDRLDAQALASGLWRYMGGDRLALRMVRVPSEAAEDAREWQRERDRLMSARRGGLDRISKKLRSHGVWTLSKSWREALRTGRLQTFSGALLSPMLQAALVIELDRVEATEAHLTQLQKTLSAIDPATAERVERLTQLSGIGRVGARGLALQLYWRDFDNRRQVGACVGLVGTPYDSGTMRQDQGISKAGDPRLRALLVELAWLWLRYQPGSALAKWFAQRTQGGSPRNKRIMIVAVARKLAIALWRYLKDGAVPEGARFKASAAATA